MRTSGYSFVCNWCVFLHGFYFPNTTVEASSKAYEMPGLPDESQIIVDLSQKVREDISPSGQTIMHIKSPTGSFFRDFIAITEADDLASSLIIGRPPVPIVNSKRAFEEARDWLAECRHHKSCPSQHDTLLPKRVIDLGSENHSGPSRLFETEGISGSYATLSYVWGNSIIGVTTSANINSREKYLDEKDLPVTVTDAIYCAKSLGIRYLWIESICIIQDSAEDMTEQLSMMHRYYHNSLVTIVAACAKDTSQGFLEDQKPFTYTNPVTRLPIWAEDGKLGTMRLHDLDSLCEPTNDPIRSRAWTYQEKLLSPRMLIYGSKTLRYECAAHSRYLGSHPYRPHTDEYRLPIYKELEGDIGLDLESNPSGKRWMLWANLVNHYSKLKLTKYEDRLVAFAGVVEHLSHYPPFSPTSYHAGLWEGQALSTHILWSVSFFDDDKREHKKLRLPRTGRRPSWSWGSVNSPVFLKALEISPGRTCCEILDISTVPLDKRVPLGATCGGVLTIKGRVRQALLKLSSKPAEEEETKYELVWASKDDSARNRSDAPVPERLVAYLDDIESGLLTTVLCLRVRSCVRNFGTYRPRLEGLILYPVEGTGCFRRIGIFTEAAHGSFKDCEVQIINII